MQKTIRRLGFTPARLFPAREYIPALDLRSRERREEQEKNKRIAAYNATIRSMWGLVAFVAVSFLSFFKEKREEGGGN